MKYVAPWVLLFTCVCRAVEAQEPSSQERIRQLEVQVRHLQERLDALSASADAIIRAELAEIRRQLDLLTREIETIRSGVPEKKQEALPEPAAGLGPAASRVYLTEHGVSIGGYGEVLYRNFASRRQDGEPSGADDRVDLTRAVFYFGYRFDEHFLFNSEIEYEHAVAASDKNGEVEVEFAYLDYRRTRAFNLRSGLLLIPMGLVNELHEPPVYLGALRPDVEELVIPSTWRELGLGAYGDAGPVAWRFYFVNGLDSRGFDSTGIREGRQEGSLAVARNWAVTGRADLVSIPGATFGLSFFSGDAAQGRRTPSGRSYSARTTLWDLHGQWRWRGLDVRALWVDSRVSDAAAINETNGFSGKESVGSRQRGWYIQAGYDPLAATAGSRISVTPFARYEKYDTQASVPRGFSRDPANNAEVWTFGAVFKPIPNIAIKADWQRRRNAAATGINQFNLGTGWLF